MFLTCSGLEHVRIVFIKLLNLASLNDLITSWNTVLFRITAKVVALFPEILIIMEAIFNAWLILNFQVTFQPQV